MRLIKGQSSKASFCQAVEEIAQDLDLRIKNIVTSEQEDGVLGPTDTSPARVTSFSFLLSFIQNIISLLFIMSLACWATSVR